MTSFTRYRRRASMGAIVLFITGFAMLIVGITLTGIFASKEKKTETIQIQNNATDADLRSFDLLLDQKWDNSYNNASSEQRKKLENDIRTALESGLSKARAVSNVNVQKVSVSQVKNDGGKVRAYASAIYVAYNDGKIPNVTECGDALTNSGANGLHNATINAKPDSIDFCNTWQSDNGTTTVVPTTVASSTSHPTTGGTTKPAGTTVETVATTKATTPAATTPSTTPSTKPVTTPSTAPVTTPSSTPATTPSTAPATTPSTKPVTTPSTAPVTTPSTAPATTPSSTTKVTTPSLAPSTPTPASTTTTIASTPASSTPVSTPASTPASTTTVSTPAATTVTPVPSTTASTTTVPVSTTTTLGSTVTTPLNTQPTTVSLSLAPTSTTTSTPTSTSTAPSSSTSPTASTSTTGPVSTSTTTVSPSSTSTTPLTPTSTTSEASSPQPSPSPASTEPTSEPPSTESTSESPTTQEPTTPYTGTTLKPVTCEYGAEHVQQNVIVIYDMSNSTVIPKSTMQTFISGIFDDYAYELGSTNIFQSLPLPFPDTESYSPPSEFGQSPSVYHRLVNSQFLFPSSVQGSKINDALEYVKTHPFIRNTQRPRTLVIVAHGYDDINDAAITAKELSETWYIVTVATGGANSTTLKQLASNSTFSVEGNNLGSSDQVNATQQVKQVLAGICSLDTIPTTTVRTTTPLPTTTTTTAAPTTTSPPICVNQSIAFALDMSGSYQNESSTGMVLLNLTKQYAINDYRLAKAARGTFTAFPDSQDFTLNIGFDLVPMARLSTILNFVKQYYHDLSAPQQSTSLYINDTLSVVYQNVADFRSDKSVVLFFSNNDSNSISNGTSVASALKSLQFDIFVVRVGYTATDVCNSIATDLDHCPLIPNLTNSTQIASVFDGIISLMLKKSPIAC